MAEREVIGWFTVNGQHRPIYEGESKEAAYNREIATSNEKTKQSQIAKNKEQADKLNNKSKSSNVDKDDKIDYDKKTADGEVAKDGSITMEYCHISNKTANFGKQFGQNLEPSGEYMTYISSGTKHIDEPNYHYGNIHFSKPLILEHKSTGETGWKKDLSDKFGGKTGKALSTAIKKEGYDAVVTYEIFRGNKSWVEIVNLNGKKQ